MGRGGVIVDKRLALKAKSNPLLRFVCLFVFQLVCLFHSIICLYSFPAGLCDNIKWQCKLCINLRVPLSPQFQSQHIKMTTDKTVFIILTVLIYSLSQDVLNLINRPSRHINIVIRLEAQPDEVDVMEVYQPNKMTCNLLSHLYSSLLSSTDNCYTVSQK